MECAKHEFQISISWKPAEGKPGEIWQHTRDSRRAIRRIRGLPNVPCVYCFRACRPDGTSVAYIGETGRRDGKRILEHLRHPDLAEFRLDFERKVEGATIEFSLVVPKVRFNNEELSGEHILENKHVRKAFEQFAMFAATQSNCEVLILRRQR